MMTLPLLWAFTLFLSIGCVRSAQDIGACSLPLSREAAVILATHWNAVLLRSDDQPARCPLQVESSRFSSIASAASVHRDQWHHCSLCGASAATQREIDEHLVSAHADMIHSDWHCLSAVCDVLGCPSLPGVDECTEQSMDALKRRCLHIAHQCFDGSAKLFDAMSSRICEPLRCVDGRRALPRAELPVASFLAAALQWAKLILAFGFVVLFYGFFMMRREATIADDLTRLAVHRRHFQAKLFEKEKLKGY